MRGENTMREGARKQKAGTSPRARGKLWHMIEDVESFRNIPACAGKTVQAQKVS